MTEKRFKINTSEIGHIYIDNLDGEHMTWRMMEDTLNQLLEENEQLKNDCGILVQSNQDYRKEIEQLKHKVNCLQDRLDDYVMVEKENEQLKSKLTDCNEAVWSWSKSYNRVYDENEQLKSENHELKLLQKAEFDELAISEIVKQVSQENEQLKQEIQSIYEIIEEYVHTHHAHSSMRMKKQIEKVMWND